LCIKIELLSYTANGLELAAQAAGICVGTGGTKKGLRAALESGHESIIEHIVYTFRIEGVSRSLLAQLSRHRLASLAVESQRYVKQDGFKYVVPPSIPEHLVDTYIAQMSSINDWYNAWLYAGVPQEDARYILPNACKTNLIITMNARELRHFFLLRCCNRAQWELRQLAEQMLVMCRETTPIVFDNAGAPCKRGKCPEKKPCGKGVNECLI
jgi:thymidylate synthase (FAD)